MGDKHKSFLDKEVNEMIVLQEIVSDLNQKLALIDSYEDLVEYNHALYALIEKQHVIYTRLKLDNDPRLTKIRQGIEQITLKTGRTADEPVEIFFTEMKKEIKESLETLTNEDLDDFYNIPDM